MRNQKIIEDFRKELFVAIEKHDFYSAKASIELAENMKIKENVLNPRFGIPPIHFAIEKDSIVILEFLLKEGANVDIIYGKHLSTALHIAARDNKVAAGEFLLKYGAYINAKDVRYQTPLHLASSHCQLDMVDLLLASKAGVNIQDWERKTALDVVGDKVTCSSDRKKEISLMLKLASRTASEVEISKVGGMESSAEKPSSFVNSMFNWVGASITAAFNQSTPALPSAQQPVTHLAESPIGFSQVDLYGTALLAGMVIGKFTGRKYSRPLDDSLLTLEQIKERKVSAIERNVKMAISEFEELYQYPGSSLSNTTISKGINHQKFF